MKNCLVIVLAMLISLSASAENGELGTTSEGTVGIFIIIPPKPIPEEITTENPRPWEERCSEEGTECEVTETANGVEVLVKPI